MVWLVTSQVQQQGYANSTTLLLYWLAYVSVSKAERCVPILVRIRYLVWSIPTLLHRLQSSLDWSFMPEHEARWSMRTKAGGLGWKENKQWLNKHHAVSLIGTQLVIKWRWRACGTSALFLVRKVKPPPSLSNHTKILNIYFCSPLLL